jgi:hypothetical protein
MKLYDKNSPQILSAKFGSAKVESAKIGPQKLSPQKSVRKSRVRKIQVRKTREIKANLIIFYTNSQNQKNIKIKNFGYKSLKFHKKI